MNKTVALSDPAKAHRIPGDTPTVLIRHRNIACASHKTGGAVSAKRVAGAVLLLLSPLMLLMGAVKPAIAAVFCGRPYAELFLNPGPPFNAVGFLNNGCTAFLIDANHIAAAAHCFVDITTGQFQTGLRFYPNFHPSRVTANETHVPRGDVIRAVVGSRAGDAVLGSGMDWGIAAVGNWTDTSGLDMTPLKLAPSVPGPGTALVNPAYTRHHFPFDDNDAIAWDNMAWDSTQCSWIGTNHGMWAITMRPAPIFDGVHRDTVACNSRWGGGMVHANCTLTSVMSDVIYENCSTTGGSSGSPVIYQDATGRWQAIGVIHGGGPTDFSQLNPTCTPDTPGADGGGGASVDRFRFAPRFASSVAVNRRPDNRVATALYAVDNDLNRVVYRSRSGAAPTYTSGFDYWTDLGSPYPGATLSKIAACAADRSDKPQIFAVVGQSGLWTRAALSAGAWGAWSNFGLPPAISTVADIDATADVAGRCLLLMVAKNGSAYVRAKISDSQWGDWFTVASGTFKAVTALNYDGVIWAALIDTAGNIWRTSLGSAGWTAPVELSRPPGITAWRDIDMTWDEAARGFMLATPVTSGNRLWFMPMYGSGAWTQWRYFDTKLWAPGAPTQPAPDIQSVTASRWMEDPPGVTSPVVFVTDNYGNIYFVEFARVGTIGWNLSWKSFYHENIAYP